MQRRRWLGESLAYTKYSINASHYYYCYYYHSTSIYSGPDSVLGVVGTKVIGNGLLENFQSRSRSTFARIILSEKSASVRNQFPIINCSYTIADGKLSTMGNTLRLDDHSVLFKSFWLQISSWTPWRASCPSPETESKAGWWRAALKAQRHSLPGEELLCVTV